MTHKSESVARSIYYTLLSFVAPLICGLIATPIIINNLGLEKFGLLSLSWVAIGYFSVFDLGLGRALTQGVSTRLGSNRSEEITSLVTGLLKLMLGISAAGFLALFLLSGWLLDTAIKVPPSLTIDAQRTILAVAFGTPVVVLFGAVRGGLEAFGQFRHVAIARGSIGVWTFISPLILLPFAPDVWELVLILIAGRVVILGFISILFARLVRGTRVDGYTGRADITEALRIGGWIAVSNFVSPLLTYLDRFFVSGMAGLTAVAYYATPYDLVSRLSFIPESAFLVLFPKFSEQLQSDRAEYHTSFSLTTKSLWIVMLIMATSIVAGSHTFLELWIGPDFADNSSTIMALLAIGLFVNSMARPSYNAIQALGKSWATALIHVIELPIYLLALTWSLANYGVAGAAFAWLGRASLDFVLLNAVGARFGLTRNSSLTILGTLATVLLLLFLSSIPDQMAKALLGSTIVLASPVVFWKGLLDSKERARIAGSVKGLRRR